MASVPSGYTITPLIGPGVINVTCVQTATSINDQGYVVGDAGFSGSSTADSPVYAFAWHAGTFTELPDPSPLPQSSGDGTCNTTVDAPNDVALKITSAGSILGWSDATHGTQEVVWPSPSGTAATQVSAGACTGDGEPVDMNASGAFAGEYQVDASSASCTIVYPKPYTDAATFQPSNGAPVQVLAPAFPATNCGGVGRPYSQAFGQEINNHNQILVVQEPCPSGYSVDLWQNGTLSPIPLSLPGLPLGGVNEYQVLNDSGVAVGTTGTNQPAYSVDAGPAIPLRVPSGVTGADPVAIDDAGDVIGQGGSPAAPILWPGDGSGEPDAAQPPILIKNLLSATGLGNVRVVAINDSGEILAELHVGTASQAYVVLTPNALVVNSTALTSDDPTSLATGVCNTTPSATTATCTLVAAIQVANRQGGGTIDFNVPRGSGNTFDGSVPQIQAAGAALDLIAPTTIDGTSQPGPARVEVSGSATDSNHSPRGPFTHGLSVGIAGAGSTIRGLVVNGFNDQLFLQGGNDTIQDDWLGTDAAGTAADTNPLADNNQFAGMAQIGVNLDSSGNQIGGSAPGQGNVLATDWSDGAGSSTRAAAAIYDESAPESGNTIEGNTIGLVPGTHTRLTEPLPGGLVFVPSLAGLALLGNETVGGSAAGAGNTIAPAGTVGGASVVEGNTLYGGLEAQGTATIGGVTSAPGTAPGNDFAGPLDSFDGPNDLDVQGNGVRVEGNRILDASRGGIEVTADHVTVGGASAGLANLIQDNGAPQVPFALMMGTGGGIVIAGNDDLVENDTLVGNGLNGGVQVEDGTGNTIVANTMRANANGIILGSAGYQYNTGSPIFSVGPNHDEPYPILRASRSTVSAATVSGDVEQAGTVRLELYSEASCHAPGITPGQGEHLLGTRTVTSRIGFAAFTITGSPLAAGQDAVTATATTSDGSTSEFSPCLHRTGVAPPFTRGMRPPSTTVPVTGPSAPADDLARASAKRARPTGHGTFVLLCPAGTAGACVGTATVATTVREPATLLRGRFTTKPGLAAKVTLRLPARLFAELKHRHRMTVTLTTVAHDRARHRHHRTDHIRLQLVYVSS